MSIHPRIKALAATSALFYIVGAFVTWDFDPYMWDSTIRFFIAVASLVAAVVMTPAEKPKHR